MYIFCILIPNPSTKLSRFPNLSSTGAFRWMYVKLNLNELLFVKLIFVKISYFELKWFIFLDGFILKSSSNSIIFFIHCKNPLNLLKCKIKAYFRISYSKWDQICKFLFEILYINSYFNVIFFLSSANSNIHLCKN